MVGLGGSDASKMLGKALWVFGALGRTIGVGVGWFGWKLVINSTPARTRVVGSSRHGLTQRRSFVTQCPTAGCC